MKKLWNSAAASAAAHKPMPGMEEWRDKAAASLFRSKRRMTGVPDAGTGTQDKGARILHLRGSWQLQDEADTASAPERQPDTQAEPDAAPGPETGTRRKEKLQEETALAPDPQAGRGANSASESDVNDRSEPQTGSSPQTAAEAEAGAAVAPQPEAEAVPQPDAETAPQRAPRSPAQEGGAGAGPDAHQSTQSKGNAQTGSGPQTLREERARADPMVKGLGSPALEGRVNTRPPAARDGGPKPPSRGGGGGGGGGGGSTRFHRRMGPENFEKSLRDGMVAVSRNMGFVMLMTCATNILVLAIPIYLFQISDRVLTSRSVDTLIMLTVVIAAAVILQSVFDAVRRFMLMRTAVEIAARLGAPILSAAAHASLHGSGREYQALGDLQQVRGFLTSGTLMAFLDVPFAPLFMVAIFLVHPHLGFIVTGTAIALLVIAIINQKLTAKPFAKANLAQSRANLHLDSMTRNSQIINALAMIPEAVSIWGRDTAASLTSQVRAQDRNVVTATLSRGVRLLTQVGMLGWGAYLAIQGEITGGMVIAASIIAGRALAPVEGAIEGWNAFLLSRAAYGRISNLLTRSGFQFERLRLPQPQGRLDVERLLYVPGGTKQVVLNAISFSLEPGDTLAVIGNSGAGKTTLGKMLVGSILPTSGNVRLDLMDLRNWDPRQLGENIGYVPQDVQLFPGTIKDNIGRMRQDATDEQIHRAAVLADVHDMIASLPQGYETMVAADGAPLSGGQKQRIALARAFFGDPRLLVLDEPNSNLDMAGDKALARAIDHARRNQITVVVITQKPTLLSAVDKIMLLADGNVAMMGARDDVLKQLASFQQNQAPGLDNGTPPAKGDS